MTVRAVFFDLFETLVTEFEEGRRRSGRAYDYSQLLGLSNEDFKQEWAKRQAQRMNGTFGDYPEVIRDIVSGRGLTIDEEAIRSLHESRMEEKRLPFHPIRPAIIKLLKELRSKQLKIGLISNCTREEVAEWARSDLSSYFDDALFSYEVKCAKPDEAIYRLACSRLNVRPDQCLFVGDGGSHELEGARAAGLAVYHAVWFNSHIESEFPKLRQPGDLLDRWNVLR
ncbi:HAD family hydrolase [Paenibacillus sacheonensis]|uniref:HAD-IA family hydrolase n=1 Tax=Paenibacillus sacheonensis TaxID=742054 RepID=A0A7X5BX77_9BACL|nr:HAD family hydrolase [Paenibacillus sacheonensis]MBM7563139.1 putative hydrolase of the HAD superfamily [Paenibacillus sacheonensis]NBC68297.1 HAD-IA family hydrolase [Paenibacillus sacheonensis]